MLMTWRTIEKHNRYFSQNLSSARAGHNRNCLRYYPPLLPHLATAPYRTAGIQKRTDFI